MGAESRMDLSVTGFLRNTLAALPLPAAWLNSQLELVFANEPFWQGSQISSEPGCRQCLENEAIRLMLTETLKGGSGLSRLLALSVSADLNIYARVTTIPLAGEGIVVVISQIELWPLIEQSLAAADPDLLASAIGLGDEMGYVAEHRDPGIARHISNVKAYTRWLALKWRVRQPELQDPAVFEMIVNVPAVHDIGKIAVPEGILFKPGILSELEFELIKTHSLVGWKLLEKISERAGKRNTVLQKYLTIGKDVAHHHHERWDGSGYPDGLRGTDISVACRLVAVADSLDAITAHRAYKEKLHPEAGVETVLAEGERLYDPELLAIIAAERRELIDLCLDLNP